MSLLPALSSRQLSKLIDLTEQADHKEEESSERVSWIRWSPFLGGTKK